MTSRLTGRLDTVCCELDHCCTGKSALVILLRHDGAVPRGETTVLRLLAQLPDHWTQATYALACEADRIALRVRLSASLTTERVRDALAHALRDPALRGWELAEEAVPQGQ